MACLTRVGSRRQELGEDEAKVLEQTMHTANFDARDGLGISLAKVLRDDFLERNLDGVQGDLLGAKGCFEHVAYLLEQDFK